MGFVDKLIWVPCYATNDKLAISTEPFSGGEPYL